MSKTKLQLSCALAAVGIGLGAFGAHGLKAQLAAAGSASAWDAAVLYHLIHALALFVVCTSPALQSKWAFRLWTIGILLFSGSLYVLALTQWSALGPVTPIGGLAFIAGWASLIFENKR